MIPMMLRPLDLQRAARLLVTYLDDNPAGFDAVLDETTAEPHGVAGLLFAMTSVSADVATERRTPAEAISQLEAGLLHLSDEDQ